MTSRDFAYWLQGYFEIAGKESTLSGSQAEITRRHLALVFAYDQPNDGLRSLAFCYWLQGFFSVAGKTAPLTKNQVEAVRSRLNLVFFHEIDPSIDGGDKKKKKKLQAIHDGKDRYDPVDPKSLQVLC